MVEMLRRSGMGFSCFYVIALFLSLSVAVSAFTGSLLLTSSSALADDDDDDDDDDSGGGGGGGGGGGSSGGGFGGGGGGFGGGNGGGIHRGGSDGGNIFNLFRQRNARTPRRARQAAPRRSEPRRVRRSRPRAAQRRQQPRPVALPTRATNEIIALGLSDEELNQLLAEGYALIQQEDIAAVGATLVRLSVPPGTSLDDARADVRALNADAAADFNHFYRPVERASDESCVGLSCGAAVQIAWPVDPGTRGQCAANATIGMIDTGINADHDALADADLTLLPFDAGRNDLRGSSERHGTAVAAILLSSSESRAPGLVPDAKVYAVDAFFRAVAAGNVSDERTDAFTLVRAMDVIAARPITVLNLSLAGPANTTLEAMIDILAEDDVALVASAGNAGPRAAPLYPAAYPEVIGVTAVDHTNRVFRRATQGDHVDLAAPGVDVWTAASVRGIKPRTGTSFATPFVTAVVALLQSRDGSVNSDGIRRVLAESALDLGEPGHDPVYGFGLVQAPGPCVTSVRSAVISGE